jgi:hypothetical protein
MRMRTTAILSTVLLSATLVAGCGGDGGSSTNDYCDELRAAKSDFDSLNSDTPDFKAFGDAIGTLHKLADGAPSEVADEWKTLDGALTTLEKDLDEAGLSLEKLGEITEAMTTGELPEGMTQEDLADLGPTLEKTFGKLDDDKFEKAGDKIEKHAKSECNVDISGDN